MIDSKIVKEFYFRNPELVYADTSSCGLVSNSGADKMKEFMGQLHQTGSVAANSFLSKDLPRIRKRIAAFMDADEDEIALTPNFSHGLNALIPSLKQYGSVLLLDEDYPSLTQPFILNNFFITWAKSKDGFSFDLNEIAQLIKQKNIKVVAVSQVQYLTGYMIDIEALGAICKSEGAILIVDGTQSLGAVPYSFRQSHTAIYISSNYKWMNGGYGTGIMAIKKSFQEAHPPKIGGFASFLQKGNSWAYEPSVLSYEPGHMNMGGWLVAEDAINLKLALDVHKIYQHNQSLLNHFSSLMEKESIELVGPYSNASRAAIICLPDSKQVNSNLTRQKVVLKSRMGKIRLGLHFYNTLDDIEVIAKAIEDSF